MYLGRLQLGQFLPTQCLCRDASGTPTVPTAAPYMEVWSGATLVHGQYIPVADRATQTGLFRFPLHLGTEFSTGQYNILYHYTVGSFAGLDQDSFEIVTGGHADGAINAMTFFQKPQASHIVYKTDGRKLLKGRNPRL